MALNVFLTALPARPGGRRLALHLLTVVKRFVGLAPCESRRALVCQPTEILGAIVGHIERRSDHASVSDLGVHRALARNVRRLKVLDERGGEGEVRVPKGVSVTATDIDLHLTDEELLHSLTYCGHAEEGSGECETVVLTRFPAPAVTALELRSHELCGVADGAFSADAIGPGVAFRSSGTQCTNRRSPFPHHGMKPSLLNMFCALSTKGEDKWTASRSY
ncbi:hypothetical protein C8Q76DRAFT_697929 [Earliella scabrosa]|nr:hypothetical protein C8Q76DRAFT_697929 [Earliella scabrosa]